MILTLVAVAGIFRIKIETDFNIFKLNNSVYQERLDETDSLFGTSDQIILQIKFDGRELSEKMVSSMRDIQKYLEEMPSVKISGPAPAEIKSAKWSVNLNEQISIEGLKNLQQYYSDMGKLAPIVQRNDNIYAVFTLFHDESFNGGTLHNLEDFLDARGLNYSIAGDTYMQQKILEYIKRILLFLPPAALILILTVFRTQMGSIKATIFSVMPAGIAAVWTLGIVGWIGRPVSIVTVLAPIFTIVIGSADGLHFVSHVQDEEEEGSSREQSIVTTLRMVGVPIIITTITSMAGFLSLLIMNTAAIHDLAVFAALGIFLAGVATWYMLPLILLGEPVIKHKVRRKVDPGTAISRIWGIPSFIILAVLTVLAIFGSEKLNTEFSQLLIFRNNTGVYRSFENIMEVNGGSIPVYVLIKTEDDPLSPEYGEAVLELEQKLEAAGTAVKVLSIYDAYAAIYATLKGLDNPEYPHSKTVTDIISRMSSANSTLSGNLLNRSQKAVKLIIFPPNLDNSTLDLLSDEISAFDSGNGSLSAELTGSQFLMREMNRDMIQNQAKSILLAFALIFILLFISMRKIIPSLLSLVPIAFTVLFIFGFMGFSGISLNLFTATIFSITIGVGIDYAVHFTSIWLKFRGKGAALKALKYTGRPIIANAFGLSLGLSALLLSPLRIHLYVSLLMWVAMISGVFLSLSLLPTILRLLEKDS